MKFRICLLALLIGFVVADFADARRRRRRLFRGPSITVKTGPNRTYTWYGYPQTRAAAYAAARRYRGYSPRRAKPTPVQRDAEQKATLAPIVFPSVAATQLLFFAGEPAQKATQKSAAQKAEKASPACASGHCHAKARGFGIRARIQKRRARRASRK